MQILIAVGILVTLALVGSSKRFYALRRTRVGAALTTGGWLFVFIGFLLGDHVLRVVRTDQLQAVQPLIHFCLGVVGLMVGLQIDRRLPALVPAPVRWLAIADWLLSLVAFTAVAALVLVAFGARGWGVGPVAGLLGVVGVGWSAEVRALRREGGASEQLSKVTRAAAALAGILAVVAYGLMIKSFEIDATGAIAGWSPTQTALGAGVSLAIGVAMGLMGKWLMGIAGRGLSQFLVVVIGLTALMAGAAATMGYSPLFVALCTGAVICNLSGKELDPLKRVIIEAEQPVAMVLMLVAGVMLDPRIGWAGLGLLAALLVTRAAVTRLVGTTLVPRALPEGAPAPGRATLLSLMRQSPLAIALAVGYANTPYAAAHADTPLTGGQVLTIVVLVGLLAELWTLLRGPREAPAPQQPVTGGPSTPAPDVETQP